MRTAHIVSALAICSLVILTAGCGVSNGRTSAPPAPPQASPPIVQPPLVEKTLSGVVPSGWAPFPGAPMLINPEKRASIVYRVFKPTSKTPTEVLQSGLAHVQTDSWSASPIMVSLDGQRATVLLTDNAVNGQRGNLTVRRIPKRADTPQEVTVAFLGRWPASADAELTRDFDAFVRSYGYR